MFVCIIAIISSIMLAIVVILHDQHVIQDGAMIMLLCITCAVLFGVCSNAIMKYAFTVRRQTPTITPLPQQSTVHTVQPTKNLQETEMELVIKPSEEKVCIGRSSSNNIIIIINPCYTEEH